LLAINGLGSVGSLVGRGSTVIFIIGVVFSVAMTPRLSRHLNSNRRLLFASLAATTLIFAVTWPLGTVQAIRHVGETFHPGALLSWWREKWGTRTYKLFAKLDGRRNVVLFVPAGFLWTVLFAKRGTAHAARWVVAGLCGLSFVIESVQAVSGARDADTRDLVTNTVGAAIGALAAHGWVVLRSQLPRER
jgi:VanZ family protein